MRASPPNDDQVPAADALEFQEDATAIEHRPVPRWARGTILLAAAAVLVALTWAGLAPIDKVVTAQGKLIPTTPKLVVQPLETAIIRTLNVRPGDVVKLGDVLAGLDQTFVAADVSAVEKKLVSYRMQIARLEAELADKEPDWAVLGPEATLQRSLFDQRQRERAARLVAFDREIGEIEASIRTAQGYAGTLRDRLEVSAEIEAMRSESYARQSGSKLQMLTARAERLEVIEELTRTTASLDELTQQRDAVAANRLAFAEEWRGQIGEELQNARRECDVLAEELAKANRRSTLVQLRAPADAVVLEVAERSIGSVIETAKPLVTLMPLNATLEAEVQVSGSDIGDIRLADPARIKFDAFPFQKHGVLTATVRNVSEDAFTDASVQAQGRPGAVPFFRSRLRLVDTKLRNVRSDLRLMPGMAVTAEIVVGSRTVLSYLLYPIIRTLDESLTEPS